MANEKISGMSAAATLTGSELVEVVQSGDNVRTTTQAIADLATGSGVTGTGTTNKVAKWTSSSALGDSDIYDGVGGFWQKTASGGGDINISFTDSDNGDYAALVLSVGGGNELNWANTITNVIQNIQNVATGIVLSVLDKTTSNTYARLVLGSSEIYLEGVNIPLGTAGKIAINSSGYLYTDTSGGGGGTTTNPLTIGTGLSGTSFDGSAAVTIQNQLITGLAGGQTIISGTAATDKLVIEVTSNATHTAARDLITLRKNSAAAASTSILMTIGDGQGLNNDELSIYTGNNSGTNGYLLRAGATFAYFNASSSLRLQIAAADIIQLSSSTAIMVQGITISDAKNIVLNTTTGTKIGTATSQKLAFWNKTPIVQPTTGITGAAFVSGGAGSNIKTDDTFGGYTLQQLAAIIINTGLAA